MTGVSEENDKALMVPSENNTVRLLFSITTPKCNANKAATLKISPTLQSQLPLSGAGSWSTIR